MLVTEQKQRAARRTPTNEGVADPMNRAARRGSACVVPSPAVTGTLLISALSIFAFLRRKRWPRLEIWDDLPRHLLLPLADRVVHRVFRSAGPDPD
jgi:hypothetical protein